MSSLNNLQSFLNENKKVDKEHYTHTSIDPRGTYNIQNTDINKFWKLYSDCINNNIVLTITERPGAYGPLRVDFDFKSLPLYPKRQYTPEIIKKVVKIYQEEIKDILEVVDKDTLLCLV